MKNSSFESIATIVVVMAILIGIGLDDSNKRELEAQKVKAENSFPPPPENARSFDFDNHTWVQYEQPVSEIRPTVKTRNLTLSDEEIRILREKQSFKSGGSYIYTPGRNVKSHKQLQNEQIEKYIEEHGEQIYEKLEDKYGN